MSREHSSEDGPICPHCQHQDTPDEGFYFDEATTSLTCGSCGADYTVRVYNSTSWTTMEEPTR